MTLNCINPLRRALLLSFPVLIQAPEAHINRQEIVYLAKVNELLEYIFTDGLEVLQSNGYPINFIRQAKRRKVIY